jgi:hypothetical protein
MLVLPQSALLLDTTNGADGTKAADDTADAKATTDKRRNFIAATKLKLKN